MGDARRRLVGAAWLCGFACAVAVGGCSKSHEPGARPNEPRAASPEAATEPSATTAATAVAEDAGDAGDAGDDAAPEAGLARLAGKIVLHAGDSMVGGDGGLSRALGVKFRAEGAKFVRHTEVSLSIMSFARSVKLPNLLARYKPDVVILTLGANDVFLPSPQVFAPYVETIVRKIGARECYWIGPPTWKGDTGIVAVIREHSAPCKFFDSSNLPLKRGGDRIHPTAKGGADWADLFWAYFQGTGSAAPGLAGDAGLLDAGK
ncbi:MAG TPA: SGNH/GDSL hydrolase family protein [Polyangiaceae bacterium]|nr:SGNH/GDSL hydrolase family protein [Polyangiaceae bacterium]